MLFVSFFYEGRGVEKQVKEGYGKGVQVIITGMKLVRCLASWTGDFIRYKKTLKIVKIRGQIIFFMQSKKPQAAAKYRFWKKLNKNSQKKDFY